LIQFSIVTVVRNDLEGLRKSRASLDAQIYKNWQHIIIDGASTDGTVEFISTLPQNNTTFISEPDSGIYSAMNKAWKIAQSDSYVYYLNARDIFATSESLLFASAEFDQEPKSGWGCTTHEEIQKNGEGWVCKLVSPPSIANQLYAFGYRSHQGVIMKASFIRELGGFNENYRLAADWDLIAKALQKEDPISWNYPLGRFELGGESSLRLLEAHLELKEIRKELLEQSLRKRFADDVWSAVYLRELGHKNYLTKIISLIFPTQKAVNAHKNNWGIRKFMTLIKSQRKYSGKYKVIGFLLLPLRVFFLRVFLLKREKFREKRILTLQKILGIQPYLNLSQKSL
jgi:glycosyltransferase involved in cell wall biosynthesis